MGVLGQTHVKALGNLADLSLFAAVFKWEGCKTVGRALEKHKADVPPLHCGPCPGKAPHQGRDGQAPSSTGALWQQAWTLWQGQPLDVSK